MRTETKIKHLEFIQGVINRLANNSFLIKGWAVTVFLAGLGFFLNQKQFLALPIITFVILIFWILDAYYLRQEKLYRRLYFDVVDNGLVRPFDMTIPKSKYNTDIPSTLLIMFSYPLYILYLPLIVVTITIYQTICLI